jgi:hypothetical protein
VGSWILVHILLWSKLKMLLEAVLAIDQQWEVSFPSLKLVSISLITSPQVLIVCAKKNFKKLHLTIEHFLAVYLCRSSISWECP